MKKKYKLIIWISIIVIFYCLTRIDYEISLKYSFNGTVENVSYSLKGIPTVTIKGVKYELSYGSWDFVDNKIEIGDRMIKKKDEMDVKLIKRNTKDTVNLLYKTNH